MPEDGLICSKIEAVAVAVSDIAKDGASSGEKNLPGAAAFARSLLMLHRVSQVRNSMMEELVQGGLNPARLRRLLSIDRYERMAQTKRRRAMVAVLIESANVNKEDCAFSETLAN